MAGGRPTDYNEEIVQEVCDWLASGKSLVSFCDQDGHPTRQTIFNWLHNKPEFFDRYIKARESAGHAHADDIILTSEEARQGLIDAATARVIMDAKKWAAERMGGKFYGQQQKIDHTSSDGSMKTPTTIRLVGPDDE